VRYLLDTNVWIYALAGDALVRRFLESATLTGWVGYSVISRIEVLSKNSWIVGGWSEKTSSSR